VNRIVKGIHKLELGIYHTWIVRIGSYLSPINFVLILYTFINQSPLGLPKIYWLVLVCVGLPLLLIVDVVFVFPSDLRYSFVKNPEMIDITSTLKVINDKLDELNLKVVSIEQQRNTDKK
jgi:hypothetical protein